MFDFVLRRRSSYLDFRFALNNACLCTVSDVSGSGQSRFQIRKPTRDLKSRPNTTRVIASIHLKSRRRATPSANVARHHGRRERRGIRSHGLAIYLAVFIRHPRLRSPLPGLQGILRHADDHVVLPHLLLLVHTTVLIERRQMPNM